MSRPLPRLLRRALERLAPTWFASPLRRTVQAVSLIAFLALLFFVCYPYTARPARNWHGWVPQQVDAQTGRVTAGASEPPLEAVPRQATLFATDAGVQPPESLGAFRVTRSDGRQLDLAPEGDLSPERLDRLAASFGPWSLHEAEPGSWPAHYTRDLEAKEIVPAELFLALDPLVSISTALAARAWIGALAFAGAIVLICLFVPRGFCAYLCPLGTLIDLFDWVLKLCRLRRAPRATLPRWSRTKYYLLAAALAASVAGVLVSGFVAAIPVVTRGMVFLVAPLQTAHARGWHQVPPMHVGHWLSIGLFMAVLGLGIYAPRAWCKFVCPTGAVFSLANRFRLMERRVERCDAQCGRCRAVCPFDAIDDDFGTRPADCAFCRTCQGVCRRGAIRYVPRWAPAAASGDCRPHAVAALRGRRGLLLAAIGGVGAAAGIRLAGPQAVGAVAPPPVRPPGSVPEPQFLQLCVRCGECYRACPNDAIQPLRFQHGLNSLWTPQVVPDWSGCEASCNACGQVCPTGAIRPLPLEEKRFARIGLAVVDQQTCLPYVGHSACQLCVDECAAAGYNAIEFMRVGAEVDADGQPIEESGWLAPVVLPERCVGCGLCQTRCRAINAVAKALLDESAIVVVAGEGREDRLASGSYAALRQQEQQQRRQDFDGTRGSGDGYLPEFLDGKPRP